MWACPPPFFLPPIFHGGAFCVLLLVNNYNVNIVVMRQNIKPPARIVKAVGGLHEKLNWSAGVVQCCRFHGTALAFVEPPLPVVFVKVNSFTVGPVVNTVVACLVFDKFYPVFQGTWFVLAPKIRHTDDSLLKIISFPVKAISRENYHHKKSKRQVDTRWETVFGSP